MGNSPAFSTLVPAAILLRPTAAEQVCIDPGLKYDSEMSPLRSPHSTWSKLAMFSNRLYEPICRIDPILSNVSGYTGLRRLYSRFCNLCE